VEDDSKKALRAQIKDGAEALDRGDFVEIDEADLESYLETLTVTPSKRALTHAALLTFVACAGRCGKLSRHKRRMTANLVACIGQSHSVSP